MALAALALFAFVFLAVEYRLDANVGLLAGSEHVVLAQGAILGASVLGFVGYAPLVRLARRGSRVCVVEAIAAVVAVLGMIQVELPTGALQLEALGCVTFVAFGVVGAAAHHAFATAFRDDPKLATGAGAAYAAGILLQFTLNLADCAGVLEFVLLGMATVGVVALGVTCAGTTDGADASGDVPAEPSRDLVKRVCWSIALVVILAALFSTLDNVVTLSNARGVIALETWPRLFLAASGLIAGLVFDLAERRYMGIVMFGVAVLSTISILAVEAGADPTFGLVVFYLSSGFFVTFFTATFTQLAPRMRVPELWAGMGRAANNLCAFVASGISLVLVTSGDVALIMIIALVLLVVAGMAFFAAGLFRLPQTSQERELLRQADEVLFAPGIEERRRTFVEEHGLTTREVDVLVAVTQDERPLKLVADELGISLRMVQRHLSSIYQKTGVQTRAGLTKTFPSA